MLIYSRSVYSKMCLYSVQEQWMCMSTLDAHIEPVHVSSRCGHIEDVELTVDTYILNVHRSIVGGADRD